VESGFFCGLRRCLGGVECCCGEGVLNAFGADAAPMTPLECSGCLGGMVVWEC
jgi:hypothetical protein